jgi:hypothetical protein
VAFALGAVALLVASCADAQANKPVSSGGEPAKAASSSASAAASDRYGPAASTRTSYSMGGISLDPAVGLQPTISAAQAVATCGSEGACLAGVPAVSLQRLTDTQAGQIQADNSVHHTYTNRLVWTMKWDDPSCGSGLGPRAPLGHSAAARPTVNEVCDYLAFVDAASGHFLFAYDGPAG